MICTPAAPVQLDPPEQPYRDAPPDGLPTLMASSAYDLDAQVDVVLAEAVDRRCFGTGHGDVRSETGLVRRSIGG